MSLLNVEKLSHTFGGRTLFKDVSFRLLAEDHVGLVGANGVGKSTLMNIITGQLIHDSGRVEWTPGVHYGYLDQHTVLTPGKTMRDVLRDAFLPLFEQEKALNEVTVKMADATPEELEELLEEMGQIQDRLDAGGFYSLEIKIEDAARGLGLDVIGLDRDVAALSGGQRTKVLLAKLLLEQPQVLLLDEPTNHLDIDAKAELKRALKAYKGTIVLVCHEPDFYEDWITKIWNVEEWSQNLTSNA